MMEKQTLLRIQGCGVGAAIGDALGMSLEFGPCRSLNHLVRKMTPGRLPAGSFTDDTEMSLALAESLIAYQPLDGADLANRFISWQRSRPPDIGIQTSRTLGWISNGLPWQEVALRARKEMPDGAGNGSLMRCWPVAVAWWKNDSQLETDSIVQSQITHPHPDCLSACILVNRMIATLIHGTPTQEAFELSLDQTALAEDFKTMLLQAPKKRREQLKNSGWIRHTLESAVWGLLTTQSFEEAVIQVVNLGGDADTAGAVTGALAGAVYGLDAIPPQWQDQLHGEWPLHSGKIWKIEDFKKLVEQLSTENHCG
jgi:ADP-ribosyl-[dinitrogen reductase] hydrolase